MPWGDPREYEGAVELIPMLYFGISKTKEEAGKGFSLKTLEISSDGVSQPYTKPDGSTEKVDFWSQSGIIEFMYMTEGEI